MLKKLWKITVYWIYPRKGEGVSASMWENLFLIDAPLADVSSTEIREMLGEGQDISPYVPQPALPLILNYYSVKENPVLSIIMGDNLFRCLCTTGASCKK